MDEEERDEDDGEDEIDKDEDVDAINAVEITFDAVVVNWEVGGETTVVAIVLELPPSREAGKVSVIVT